MISSPFAWLFVRVTSFSDDPYAKSHKILNIKMENFRTCRYENFLYIGHGGLGDVYCAHSLVTGRKVAVRKIDISTFPKDSWDSLLTNCRSYIDLVHPNLVRYYDVLIEHSFEQLLFEMELCDGGSLQGVIKKMRSEGLFFDEGKIWDIAFQIAAGLSWLHSPFNGIGAVPHCNIKPSNVLVGNQGVYKLADFGLQGIPLSTAIPPNQSGSALYRAPELRDTMSRPSPKSDIWSFGLVLWTLCTLRHPIFNLDEITEEPSIMLPAYSQELNELIEGCLRIDPGTRFSITDLVARTRANAPSANSRPQSAARSDSTNIFQQKVLSNTKITNEVVSSATYLMSNRPRSATLAMKSRTNLDEFSDQLSSTPLLEKEKIVPSSRPMSSRAPVPVVKRAPFGPTPSSDRITLLKTEQLLVATPTGPSGLNIMSRSQAPHSIPIRPTVQPPGGPMADTGVLKAQQWNEFSSIPLKPPSSALVLPQSLPPQQSNQCAIHSQTPSPSMPDTVLTEQHFKDSGSIYHIDNGKSLPRPAQGVEHDSPNQHTGSPSSVEHEILPSPPVDSLLMDSKYSHPESRIDSRSCKRVPKHISTVEGSQVKPQIRSPIVPLQTIETPIDELLKIIQSNDANHFKLALEKYYNNSVPQGILESCFKHAISFSAHSVLLILAEQLSIASLKVKAGFTLEPRQGMEVEFPSELMIAAQKGDASLARMHLRDIGQTYKERTALMLAAEHGSLECVKLLLGELALQNSMGETALVLAAKKGYIDCISLLQAEGNLTYSEHDELTGGVFTSGLTPLMASIRAGQKHCIHELQYLLKRQTSNGMTSLMYAVLTNAEACIPYLVDECRIVDNNGESALMKAVAGPSIHMVEFLSKYEGGIQDVDGDTALLRAIQYKNAAYVKAMLRVQKQCAERDIGLASNDGTTLFTAAIKSGCDELIYLLNAEDMSVSTQLRTGTRASTQPLQQTGSVIKLENPSTKSTDKSPAHSPLLLQSQQSLAQRLQAVNSSLGNDQMSVTKKLFSKHKNNTLFALLSAEVPLDEIDFGYLHSLAGQRDSEGYTALMVASINGNQEFVEKIISTPSMHGELGKMDSEGRSALILSILYQRIACTKLLVTSVAELSCNMTDGTTPLILAIQKRFYNVIPSLLEVAGNQNKNGKTALLVAMEMSVPLRFLGSLPEREANICDADGDNGLFYAIRNNKHLYLPRLAEVASNRPNKSGIYAIELAIERDCWQCFKILYEYEGRNVVGTRDNVGVPFKTLILSILRNNSVNILENLSLLIYNKPISIWLPTVQSTVLDSLSPAMLAARAGSEGELYAALQARSQGMRGSTHTVKIYNSRTALMEAAIRGYTGCVRLLLGEIGFRDENGRTALMLAAQNGHLGCVRLLLIESGVKTIARETALSLAVSNDMVECAELLVRREYWLSGTPAVLPFSLNMQYSKTCVEITSIKYITHLYKEYYNKYELETGRCHICLDDLCTVRCLPCGHDVACPSCVRDVLESVRAGNTKRNKCPICRTEIESWTQFFINDKI